MSEAKRCYSYNEELRGVQAQDRDQTKRQSQSKVNDTKVNDTNANDTNVNDTNASDAPELGPSLVVGRCGWIAWCEGVTDVSVHSCETSCLSMRVGGHVGGNISVPARIQISWDLVGQSVGPGLVDPSRPGCCR